MFVWKPAFLPSRLLLFICSGLFDLKCWAVVSSDRHQITLVVAFQFSSADPHPPTPLWLNTRAVTTLRWWNYSCSQRYPGGEEIGGILEMKKKQSCFLHLIWLITHCRACKQFWQEHVERHKATGKKKHTCRHTRALSLFWGISTRVSERETFLSPPPHFFSCRQPCLAVLAICSLCCGTQSCLWLQDFHKVARTSGGVLQKNEKQEEKWAEVSQAVVPAVIWDRWVVQWLMFWFWNLRFCVWVCDHPLSQASEPCSTLQWHANTTVYVSHSSSC